MANNLKQYKILIYASTGAAPTAARHSVVKLTWDAGHYASLLESSFEQMRNGKGDEFIAAADVLVVLCEEPGLEILAACEYAVNHHRPVLAFVMIPADSENVPLDRFGDLEASVHRIPGGSVTRVRSEKVEGEYLIRLDRLIRELDNSRSLNRLEGPVAISNPFIANFVRMAEQWHVLNERCMEDADLKRYISAFVLDLYSAALIRGGITRWFLESGSTLAYFTESLTVNGGQLYSQIEEIETNNILAYLQLASGDSPHRFSLYPPGRPEGKYGATFGSLQSLTPPLRQASGGHFVDENARFEIDQVKNHLKRQLFPNGIIFGATSGVELDPQSPFQGFHVGSYPNMLLKRSYLEASREHGLPIILITSESKVPAPFEATKCFPVCDFEFTWETVCREVPLAIACVFRNSKMKDNVMSRLKDLGFIHAELPRKDQTLYPIVVSNDRFWEARKTWFRLAQGEGADFDREGDSSRELLEASRPM